jgi:cytochrome c oxidase assembly factor CtaG
MTGTDLLLSAWRFDPVAPLGCAAAIGAYAATGSRAGLCRVGAALTSEGSSTSARERTRGLTYLVAALGVLVVALLSPLGTLADGVLFSAHMLQHLLLLLVVPPLALLGCAASTMPRSEAPSPHVPSPSVPGAWLGGVAAMWLWHAPALCNAATRSVGVHLVQELSLLALGTWFYWPILAPRAAARLPPLAGILYLLTACIACTLLGVAITFSPIEVCSAYLAPTDARGALPLLRGAWGLTPARDQQIGGLLMWLPACLVYGGGILGILARWYQEDSTPPPPRLASKAEGTPRVGSVPEIRKP